MNNFFSFLVDLFLIKYFWLFRSVSKHLVIGMNNFYFLSCFSRFIFNQVFLAFRSLSKCIVMDNLFFFFLLLQNLFLLVIMGSVSKHLVIGMNNFYSYSTFSRFIFNQVFLAFRRVYSKQ